MDTTTEKRRLRVFLSHAHSDKDAVHDLFLRLLEDGLDVWMDKENLLPGQDWELEIRRAVRAADVVVVCLSQQFSQEGFRQKEVRLALDTAMEQHTGEIFIIPARLEACEPPESLSRYHWVDLFAEDGYARLLRALQVRAEKIGAALRQSAADPRQAAGGQTHDGESHNAEKKLIVSRQSEPLKTRLQQPSNTAILVAVIGLFGTIIAALLGSPLIERWLDAAPDPTQTITIEAALPESSLTPEPGWTPTVEGTSLERTATVPVNANPSVTPTGAQRTGATATEPLAATTDTLPTLLTDARGVQMVLIPRGEFTMGSSAGDESEQPAHSVYLDNYYLDRYEVSNDQYRMCVEAGACGLPFSTIDFDNPAMADHPVVFLSWPAAAFFCEWRGGRLPTEAEWEKAARGSEQRTYPWGEGIDETYANFDKYVAGGKTTPVGQYERGQSVYGVYDLAGNVWEFVADWYAADYYAISPSAGPSGPRDGEYRVVRGGAFDNPAELVTAFSRSWFYADQTNSSVGFRCARDAGP
jgi:formylglycine-generating enzyme required for sulfatase activity